MMKRIFLALLAVVLYSGIANATTGLPYVVNYTPSVVPGSNVNTPAGGTCLFATADINNSNGCSCPSGWTSIQTPSDADFSMAQCQRASAGASATYNFTCNGSSTGVVVSEVSIANVASCTPDAFSTANVHGGTLTSATATLTTDWDIEFQSVANNASWAAWKAFVDNTSALTIIDDQGGFGIGWYAWGYNVDHTDPITVKFEGSGNGLVGTVWFKPSTAPAKTLNRFIPFRDYTETPRLHSNVSSSNYTPNPWIQSGDLMFCYNQIRAVDTPTCDAAWTQVGSVIQNSQGQAASMIMCDKAAGANEHANTYSFGAGAGGPHVQTVNCAAFHNIDVSGAAPYTDAVATANVGGGSGSGAGGSGATLGTAGVTPSKDGDLVINIGVKASGLGLAGVSGDVPMPSAVTMGPSNADGPGDAYLSAFIQPTSDPTGLHNIAQNSFNNNAMLAAMVAFKTTSPSVDTVCNPITIRGQGVPMSTDSQPASGGTGFWQRNPHYVAYGAQNGDLMVSTDDTDASILPAASAYVSFGNLTGPTIRANSNNGAESNNEAVITTPITYN